MANQTALDDALYRTGKRIWHLLTPREQEIAGMRLAGFTVAEICDELAIAQRTYWQHKQKILRKIVAFEATLAERKMANGVVR